MKSIFKSKILLSVALIIILVLSIIIMIFKINSSYSERTAEKQLSLGEKYLSELEYKKAIVAFGKVAEIEPRNMQAYLGLTEAYAGLGQTDEAIRILEDAVEVIVNAIADNGEIPDNSEDIYLRLADMYKNNGNREKAFRIIKEGYEILGSEKLANALKKYYPEVLVSVPSGNYTTPQTIKLTSEGKRIYYTLDGSKPAKESEVYRGEILLEKGTITLKATSENEFGELGEISVYSYTIDNEKINIGEDEMTPVSESTPLGNVTSKEMIAKFGEYFYNNFSTADCNVFLADITHDGNNEMVVVDLSNLPTENNENLIDVHIYTYSNEKVVELTKISGSTVHIMGFLNLYILKIENKYYLYQCLDFMYQGYGSLEYKIFSLSKTGKEVDYKHNSVEGDPVADKEYNEFANEMLSYEKFLVCTLYSASSPCFKDEDYTISRAEDIFKNYYEPQDDIIKWEDPVVERYIRKAIGKPTGNIYNHELTNLKELIIIEEKISTLEDLVYCEGLTYLNLMYCQITDISYLKGLKKLEFLNLSYNNRISDISSLENLTNLQTLYLFGCLLDDISSLSNLKDLSSLILDHNDISNIDALQGLTNLTYLSLHSCNIDDIKALKKLTKLETIDLGGNQIKDISALKELVNLNKLYLDFNQLTDIGVLKYLKEITFLDLHSNQIKDISCLKGLNKLTYLDLDFNEVTDWKPVSHLPNVAGRP